MYCEPIDKELMTKVDLLKALLQFDGSVMLQHTSYEGDGDIIFVGSRIYSSNSNGMMITKPIRISVDKYQVESLRECATIDDVYEVYKEMGYFNIKIKKECLI